MPYIKQERRDKLARGRPPLSAGELNYEITEMLISYCQTNGLNYQCINDCMGACQGAALEFYRRVAAPYEEQKITENGDLDYYKQFHH